MVKLGSRRKKNPKTEQFDNYDMFAVEVDEDKASSRAKKELEKEIEDYIKSVDSKKGKAPNIPGGQSVADYLKDKQTSKKND